MKSYKRKHSFSHMSKSRTGTWLAWILGAIGVLIIAIPALLMYLRTTAKSLHPDPSEIPSEMQSRNLPASWASAITRGQQIVRTGASEGKLPGISVAVGSGGSIVWAEGFGFANIEANAPVTPEHRFRIGTASQVLTSAAAGLLLEEGRLNLDDPIQTYVPEFPQKQWTVTLRQLMAQTSGVRHDGGDDSPLLAPRCEGPRDAVPIFAQFPLVSEPGTRRRNSCLNWVLASAAIEAAAKKPFLTVMRERVFDPLGMQDTLSGVAKSPIPNRATFYFPRFAADPTYGLHLMEDFDFSCYAGSAIFLSTPSDLVRFAMAVQNGKLLRPATVQLLQTPSGKPEDYGLGWDLNTITLGGGRQARVVGLNGDIMGGMVASLLTLPGQGISVAVITNIAYADTFSMATKIAQAFAK